MQNDRSKFKDEFKSRVYKFALDVIGFMETVNKLLKETTEIANILATSVLTLKGRK